jgi:ferrochelatase
MTSGSRRTAVLIVGFGGPDSLESVRPFMCNLTGREPSDAAVDQVCMHYLSIGGQSPLLEIAESMAAALSEHLAKQTCEEVPVLVGMRYSSPTISDAVSSMTRAGVDRIVLCPLSPFESRVTHGAYRTALADALSEYPNVEVVEAPPIGTLEAFSEIVAASAISSLERLEATDGSVVVFTAHSLPLSDLAPDDPYVGGLKNVLDRVAEYLGWQAGREGAGEPLLPGIRTFGSVEPGSQPWVLAYQSKGMRPGEWLGPDAEAVVEAAAHTARITSIVAVPVGFVTDHLETLYDLDIELADCVLGLGMEFVRGPVANDHEHLIRALAEVITPLL